MSPAARTLLELLAAEIAAELLCPIENADESGQEQRRRMRSNDDETTAFPPPEAT
jgi:hypothetical protein